MLASVSPLSIVKHRPGFGQTVRPVAGAIVASPVLGDWKPDPDYFFHWFRDSAVVIDALRLLYVEQQVGDEALRHLRDFIRFSLALNRLDGRVDAAAPDRRARVAPDFLQYLRDDEDLARAHGDAVAAETRVNPDGTLDISKWARPQHDGPPLRALALLRWAAVPGLDASLREELAELVRFDLGFTLRRGGEPSFDIWEEESGHHYYTLRVSAAALAQGAAWLGAQGDEALAQRCRDASSALLRRLDAYWTDDTEHAGDIAGGYYRSRRFGDEWPRAKSLDIAVMLSAIHSRGVDDVDAASTATVGRPRSFGTDAQAADGPTADSDAAHAAGLSAARTPGTRDVAGPSAARTQGTHDITDPRMHATLARLDALFAALYPINQARPPGHGTAMGRYEGDVYHSGGPWYVSTLGAAEFCFRAAASAAADEPPRWFARGDAYLATVRAYTPESGDLSEQFDPRTGQPASAKHLAWSYAAFISCVSARRRAAATLEASAPR